MTKDQVQVGQNYRMRHSSGVIVVQILAAVERQGYGPNSRTSTHWIGRNSKTGREIQIRSAVKLSEIPR
jgi:hypothetical protein